VKALVKLLDDLALCTLLAPGLLGVLAFATILHFQNLVHAAHSTKSPVRVGQLILLNLSASCHSEKFEMLPDLASAGLFGLLGTRMPPYRSLQLHYVSHSLSNLHSGFCYLPHVSYLSDAACTHRVHVDC